MTRARLGSLLVAGALALSACSGGTTSSAAGPTGSPSSATSSGTASSTAPATGATTGATSGSTTGATAPTSPTSGTPIVRDTIKVPHGVRLTHEGTHLGLGHAATVAWHPTKHTVGVIRVAVTRIRQVRIRAFHEWRLDAATRRSTPYFVTATVTNVGRSDLSRVAVPLDLLDRRNTLLEASTFKARFGPCPSQPLPKKFRRHHRARVCLVYFVPPHGHLQAVAFRPSPDFQAITWRGHVQKPPKRGH